VLRNHDLDLMQTESQL